METRAWRSQTSRMDTIMPTVAAILDRYEREALQDLAPRTQKDYTRHLKVLRRTFGDWVAAELRPRDFADFLNVKKGKIQRVRQLAVFSAALSIAVKRWYWLDRNVLRDVERPKSKPRDRLIADEEFQSMKATASKRLQLAMMLALLTGQRQGDILNFRWSDIKGMTLHIYQTKTGKRIGIEIGSELEAVLDQCWQLRTSGRESEYILPTRMGTRYTSEGFRACWQRAMKKWMRLGGANFHFHDIRALAATKCATPEEAQRLLGHTSIAMTYRVYRRGIERVKSLQLGA